MLVRFLRDESGASAVEYGMLSVFFVLGILGTWQFLGNTLNDFMNGVGDYLANQVN